MLPAEEQKGFSWLRFHNKKVFALLLWSLNPPISLRTMVLPFSQIPPSKTLSWTQVPGFSTCSSPLAEYHFTWGTPLAALQGLSAKDTDWCWNFYYQFQSKCAKGYEYSLAPGL